MGEREFCSSTLHTDGKPLKVTKRYQSNNAAAARGLKNERKMDRIITVLFLCLSMLCGPVLGVFSATSKNNVAVYYVCMQAAPPPIPPGFPAPFKPRGESRAVLQLTRFRAHRDKARTKSD